MRKLFTLAFVLVAAMTASARSPLCKMPTSRFVAEKPSAFVKNAPAVANVEPRTAEEHNWPAGEYKSLGKGSMTDEMVTAIYGMEPVTFEVEVQQSVEDANFYRLVGAYGQSFADAVRAKGYKLEDTEFDKEGVKIINLDLSDPDNGYMPKSYIGCDWGYGEMYLGLPTTGRLILKDGVITAPMRGIAVGDNDGATAQNVNMKFRIVLPGYTATDYRLELSNAANCVTERKFTGSLLVGNDIAKVKYAVFPNQFEDELNTFLPVVAKDGYEFSPRGEFSFNMDMVAKETLVLVGLDANDEMKSYVVHSYYYVGDEDKADWQDVGQATVHDVALSSYGYDVEDVDMPCRLEQHKYRPGYLRLVNPYAASPYAQDRYTHKGHNHYIYIVADDPEGIYIEESPIGLDFGHGTVRIWSQCGYWLAAGESLEDMILMELCATYENNTISFPVEEQILVSAMNRENGDWYYGNGGMEIALPENFALGVDNISADADSNAPVEYYNLQGVRITRPESGLYIRRQGTRATKILARPRSGF